MKPLLLFIMMGLSVAVFAQVEQVPAFPKLPKKYLDQKNMMGRTGQLRILPMEKHLQPPAPVQADVTRVIELPQDRMPCVIPPKGSHSMPLVLKGNLTKGPGAIPNPAKPLITGE